MNTAPAKLVLVKNATGFICTGVPDFIPTEGDNMCWAWITQKERIRVCAVAWTEIPDELK